MEKILTNTEEETIMKPAFRLTEEVWAELRDETFCDVLIGKPPHGWWPHTSGDGNIRVFNSHEEMSAMMPMGNLYAVITNPTTGQRAMIYLVCVLHKGGAWRMAYRLMDVDHILNRALPSYETEDIPSTRWMLTQSGVTDWMNAAIFCICYASEQNDTDLLETFRKLHLLLAARGKPKTDIDRVRILPLKDTPYRDVSEDTPLTAGAFYLPGADYLDN